jgi:hypothetical protein
MKYIYAMTQGLTNRNVIDLLRGRLEGYHPTVDGRLEDSELWAHIKMAAAETAYARHQQNDERFGRAGRLFIDPGLFTEVQLTTPPAGKTVELPTTPINMGTEDGLFYIYHLDPATGRVNTLQKAKSIAVVEARQDMAWSRPKFLRQGSSLRFFGVPEGSLLTAVVVTADLPLQPDGSIAWDAAFPLSQDLIGRVLDVAAARILPGTAQLPDMLADGKDAVPTKTN